MSRQASDSVTCELVSADGDQGFPGRLTARVRYRLAGPLRLQIEYTAETDQETFVNLSNHAYFNLNGGTAGVENHVLWINSDRYAPNLEGFPGTVLRPGEIYRRRIVLEFESRR